MQWYLRRCPSSCLIQTELDQVLLQWKRVTLPELSSPPTSLPIAPVEPAATTLAAPAPSAMPKAPLAAAVQQGPGISSVFCLSLSQLATLLSPARGRPLVPAPTVTEPESQQDDDPVLPAPVPIPKPSLLSIPSPGISLISSGNEASAVLALQAALALQEAKLTQVVAALAAQEARAVARAIPTDDTTVEAAADPPSLLKPLLSS